MNTTSHLTPAADRAIVAGPPSLTRAYAEAFEAAGVTSITAPTSEPSEAFVHRARYLLLFLSGFPQRERAIIKTARHRQLKIGFIVLEDDAELVRPLIFEFGRDPVPFIVVPPGRRKIELPAPPGLTLNSVNTNSMAPLIVDRFIGRRIETWENLVWSA